MTANLPERLFICGPQDDPCTGLLGAYLQNRFPDAILHDFDERSGAAGTDSVWFLSQHAFLAEAASLITQPGQINIVIRQPDVLSDTDGFQNELGVLNELLRRFAKGQVSLWALSDDTQKMAEGELNGLAIEVLHSGSAVRQTERTVRYVADRDQFVIDTDRGEQPIPAKLVNWARIARHCHIETAGMASGDVLDLCTFANGLPQGALRASRQHYLFITPNGVGMGHLTRQLAIADALMSAAADGAKPKISFWCYSRAAGIIQAAGYPVILRQTAQHLGAESDDWEEWETASFTTFLRSDAFSAVLIDSSNISPWLMNALRSAGCHAPDLVWIRRGMWRPDVDPAKLADTALCNLVLIPGDLAGEADQGPTGRPHDFSKGLASEVVTAPVVFRPRNGVLDRSAARRALKLPRFRRLCLVSLGGDTLAATDVMHKILSDAAKAEKVDLVWARSPLAAIPSDSDGVNIRSVYPMSRYVQAFDGIISAAGYNSFHELLLGVDCPVLFIPTAHAKMDDQPSRAQFAASQGWSDIWESDGLSAPRSNLRTFFAKVRDKARPRGRPRVVNGADAMADILLTHLREKESVDD